MFYSSKFVTLRNGSQVLIRIIKNGDQTDVIRFFQSAPPEDRRYLNYFSANLRHLDSFLHHIDYSENIPLVALEIDKGSIIGAAFFSRGQGAINHIGKIHYIFVAPPFQKMGLGAMLLDECIRSIRLGQELIACPGKVSRFPCGAPLPRHLFQSEKYSSSATRPTGQPALANSQRL
jgi:GNAT superfamily N-acetyltransferase